MPNVQIEKPVFPESFLQTVKRLRKQKLVDTGLLTPAQANKPTLAEEEESLASIFLPGEKKVEEQFEVINDTKRTSELGSPYAGAIRRLESEREQKKEKRNIRDRLNLVKECILDAFLTDSADGSGEDKKEHLIDYVRTLKYTQPKVAVGLLTKLLPKEEEVRNDAPAPLVVVNIGEIQQPQEDLDVLEENTLENKTLEEKT